MITMLQFFYVVRLAQQGFFSIVTTAYPQVEPNAIVYFCDKLVGSSLLDTQNSPEDVRTAKRAEALDLINKLHYGVEEPVGEGFSTTYKQLRDLTQRLLSHGSMNNTTVPTTATSQVASPIWFVVPYASMIDSTTLQNMANHCVSLLKNKPAESPQTKKSDETKGTYCVECCCSL